MQNNPQGSFFELYITKEDLDKTRTERKYKEAEIIIDPVLRWLKSYENEDKKYLEVKQDNNNIDIWLKDNSLLIG
jgi:hypothetical protein